MESMRVCLKECAAYDDSSESDEGEGEFEGFESDGEDGEQ